MPLFSNIVYYFFKKKILKTIPWLFNWILTYDIREHIFAYIHNLPDGATLCPWQRLYPSAVVASLDSASQSKALQDGWFLTRLRTMKETVSKMKLLVFKSFLYYHQNVPFSVFHFVLYIMNIQFPHYESDHEIPEFSLKISCWTIKKTLSSLSWHRCVLIAPWTVGHGYDQVQAGRSLSQSSESYWLTSAWMNMGFPFHYKGKHRPPEECI